MSIKSNVCACAVCSGPECTCGCQNSATLPASACQCGEVCNCGETCECPSCQHMNAGAAEIR